MEDIKDRIKKVRVSNGLSQDLFSEKLDVKPNQAKMAEYGRQQAPGELLQKIVEIFHVDGHWLLTGEGEMYRSSTPAAASSTDPTAATLQAWIDHYAQTRTEREVQWLEVEISRRFPDYNRWLIEQGREPVSKPTLFDSLVGSLMRPLSPEQTRQLVELAETMERENSEQKP